MAKHQKITQPGEYHFYLDQPGQELTVTGVFQAKGRQAIEVSVVIHHTAPHTRATTILKGAAFDQSRLRFVGRIIIEPDCGDTQSFLTERVLLLSDTATAETVPDLEIKTDDVKCSHAATVSHIPDEQVFYLMSRGLSRKAAQNEIVAGFLKI